MTMRMAGCVCCIAAALIAAGTAGANGGCDPNFTAGSIAVLSGTLSGQTLDPSDPQIVLGGGALLEGVVRIRVLNNSEAGIFPIAGTKSWGDHATSGWEINWNQDHGLFDYDVPINAIVPSEPGTYYLFFAASWEMVWSNIISCTHWQTPGGDVWNDGNDVADWTDAQAQHAISHGWVCSKWLTEDGLVDASVPAAAVRIAVTGNCPPSYTGGKIAISSGILGSRLLDPSDPRIELEEGGLLEGSVVILVTNNGAFSDIFPVCATTSWGNHATSGWIVAEHQVPGTAAYSVPVSVTVPSAKGTYYLYFAAAWELSYLNILSCTNWATPGGNVWNDGHDVADWTDAQAQNAISLGWICSKWLTAGGLVDASIPAMAVRIVVDPSTALEPMSWGAIKELFK